MTEKMKDSGIEWIGEIPEEWNICRIKDICFIARGGSPRPIDDYLSDNENDMNWIKIGDTIKGYKYIDKAEQKIISSGKAKSRIVHKGDLLLTNSMSFGQPYILNIDGCIHDGWLVFSDYRNINKLFLYYVLMSDSCLTQFKISVSGAVVENLNIDKVGSAKIFLPLLPEQQLIVDFLDKKVGQVDDILADLNKQVEILNQYRKSLITETVTKGLNPNVEMKDSGIDWIGEIPKGWECKRLRFVMNNRDSQRKPIEASERSQNSEILYDYYGASGVIDKIDEYIFEGENLLIGEDGANLVLRNLPLIYIAKGKYWVNNHAHILYPKKGNLHYFAHQMEIIDYSEFITGSAQPKLSQENLNNVILIIPTLKEQQQIAEYLDKKCTQIDELIADKQAQIEKMEKYKKSLIYEYVTGKKRVGV